jgi:catechol 2,3-dioxygenase-like lactoylglutathione lyase family enzyme
LFAVQISARPKYTPGTLAWSDFMLVKRLEHVQLAMPAGEEERARHFYRDALGIPEVSKPPYLAERGGCWFERDELKIHLGVDPDFHPAKNAHPALLVAGLEALCEKLRGLGYEFQQDRRLEGFRRIYVHDPFGNRIELMEPMTQ